MNYEKPIIVVKELENEDIIRTSNTPGYKPVGDSDVDVFTAHNAGVMVCGVEWGFRGREELENAGADYIAKDADSLFEIIVG